jgi:hypothetical protein
MANRSIVVFERVATRVSDCIYFRAGSSLGIKMNELAVRISIATSIDDRTITCKSIATHIEDRLLGKRCIATNTNDRLLRKRCIAANTYDRLLGKGSLATRRDDNLPGIRVSGSKGGLRPPLLPLTPSIKSKCHPDAQRGISKTSSIGTVIAAMKRKTPLSLAYRAAGIASDIASRSSATLYPGLPECRSYGALTAAFCHYRIVPLSAEIAPRTGNSLHFFREKSPLKYISYAS